MNEDDYMAEMMRQYLAEKDYISSQQALPPHKRDDYAEKMAEYADDLIDRMREESWQ